MRDLLELLEHGRSDGLLVGLAWLAGREIEHDEDELRGAIRRAELLLAAGGDPRRELELDGRAVETVAGDLGDEAHGTNSRTGSPRSCPHRTGCRR